MVNCEKVPDVQWTLHSRSTRVLYDSQSNALCSHTHYTKEWIPYRLNKATNCILFTLKLTGQCWEEREVYDVLFSVQNVSWLVRINLVKGVVSKYRLGRTSWFCWQCSPCFWTNGMLSHLIQVTNYCLRQSSHQRQSPNPGVVVFLLHFRY